MPKVLIIGDIHATDSQPVCRTDEFWETQLEKANWFRELWVSLGCPVVVQPGDVFEQWKSSPAVISMVLNGFPPMVTIPGNHDLAYHSVTGYGNSALAVVGACGLGWEVLVGDTREVVQNGIHITGYPWGVRADTPESIDILGLPRVLLVHTMIVGSGITAPPGVESDQALVYLKQHPEYDLIVTGHNHTPCVASDGDRWLVNPGSFTRQTAAETHTPRVYVWDSESHSLDQISIPHVPSAITREHIDLETARDSRILAFVEHLDQMDVSISFRDNVLRSLEEESGSPGMNSEIRKLVLSSIGEV